MPDPQVPSPRVVGVDEYATREGRNYGTILVDVESRRPVDLLPDREASSLTAWLAKRPEIEVVCRDRAPFFAEGACPVPVGGKARGGRNAGGATDLLRGADEGRGSSGATPEAAQTNIAGKVTPPPPRTAITHRLRECPPPHTNYAGTSRITRVQDSR